MPKFRLPESSLMYFQFVFAAWLSVVMDGVGMPGARAPSAMSWTGRRPSRARRAAAWGSAGAEPVGDPAAGGQRDHAAGRDREQREAQAGIAEVERRLDRGQPGGPRRRGRAEYEEVGQDRDPDPARAQAGSAQAV